jgi:hypothetical protein
VSEDAAHARLGPSAMSRILACPYSVKASEACVKKPAGNAALAGTLMHAEFERAMLDGNLSIDDEVLWQLDDLDYGRQWAENMLKVTTQSAHSLIEKYDVTEFLLEERVYPGETIGIADFWGTADFMGIGRNNTCLVVADVKTGRGIVDPENNDQMLSYALGAYNALDKNFKKTITAVALAVIQPSNLRRPLNVWETGVDTLGEFASFAREQLSKVDLPDLTPTPSEGACQWCPAREVCPTRA